MGSEHRMGSSGRTASVPLATRHTKGYAGVNNSWKWNVFRIAGRFACASRSDTSSVHGSVATLMTTPADRRAGRSWWIVAGLLALIVTLSAGMRRMTPPAREARGMLSERSGRLVRERESSPTKQPRHPVQIRRPSGPPVIELDRPDPLGRTGKIACSTCHSVRPPNPANRRPSDLDEFHQGMPFDHGRLVCYSCHNPQDADTLRLADGRTVAYTDVMTLCGQCHGPQLRDYERYSHGGVNGYWDLTRGPRVRANCIDCHDPHVPRFPTMVPTFKPRDRFLVPKPDHHESLPSKEGSLRHE